MEGITVNRVSDLTLRFIVNLNVYEKKFFSDQMVLVENGDGGGDWADWRGGECLIPALVSFNALQVKGTDSSVNNVHRERPIYKLFSMNLYPNTAI